MTEIETNRDTPDAAERLGELLHDADMARRTLVRLRAALDRKATEVEGADPSTIKAEDVTRASRELARAITSAFEQEGRLQDARRIERGGGGLDLAGARAEVRRRLNRILAGRDAGEVPG